MKKLYLTFLSFSLLISLQLNAQTPLAKIANPVPTEVERIYRKGLTFLAKTQLSGGQWQGEHYSSDPGVVGLAALAFLAHGEDPVSGNYAKLIKSAIKFVISSQEKSTGYIGSSMYSHGFATLALAEAYGVVDNPNIGPALSSAVKLLLSSQSRNNHGAWRYSSSSRDADTTVAGACAIALLAARNAGIEIPSAAIKRVLVYYRTTQSADGGFGYTSSSSHQTSKPIAAIGTLIYALTKNRSSTVFKKALAYTEKTSPERNIGIFRDEAFYYLYYASQALFHAKPHSDALVWKQWNKKNIIFLKSLQNEDGSWKGEYGKTFSTAAALLSLALNYRFLPIYER